MRAKINEIIPGTFFVYSKSLYIKLSDKYMYKPEDFNFYKIENRSSEFDYDYVGYLPQGLL